MLRSDSSLNMMDIEATGVFCVPLFVALNLYIYPINVILELSII